MPDLTQLIVYVMAIGAGIAAFTTQLRRIRRENGNALEQLTEIVQQQNGNGTPSEHIDLIQVKERLDSLERGFENLKQDALRMIAKGNTRLRRAKEIAGEDLEDEEPATPPESPEEIAQLTGQPTGQLPAPAEQTDLLDQLRERIGRSTRGE